MSSTLDFTHLEGETDDNADFDSGFAAENSVSQPTVAIPPPPKVDRRKRNSERFSEESSSSDPAVLPSSVQDQINHNDVAKGPSEGFEDSFINGPYVSGSSPSSQTDQTRENGVDSTSENTDITNESNEASSSPGTFKIHYDSSRGNVTVFDGQVTTRPDGSQHINTLDIPDQWEEHERPLRKKRIRLIKIFSIVACIFFFPSGIPAAYYAFRIDKEFEAGIMRGNIDRAQKFAKRSERLIILSFVLAVMLAALTVALIERPYFENRGYHRGTLAG